MEKKLILISNDDGVEAEGLQHLTETLSGLGDIIVFAPNGPRSGMASAISSGRAIHYQLLSEQERLTIYSCSGTPTDCVKLALNELLADRKPNIVVSGINHGGNQALAVHYSGTMGAAFEGCVFGIPSIGISLVNYRGGADFSEACRIGRPMVEKVLAHGLPYGTYLNLNVPNVPSVKGIKVARQTEGKWEKEYRKEMDGNGNTIYWLTGDFVPKFPPRPDNDVALLDQGFATLVPCNLDMTDYAFMEELNKWNLDG